MARRIWINRAVENPMTFTIRNNPDGTVTLIPAPGVIVEAGTPVNAANLNGLEDDLETHLANNAIHGAVKGDDGFSYRAIPRESLIVINESPETGPFSAIAVDTEYVYTGFGTIQKLNRHDLSFVAQSVSISNVNAIVADGDFLYVSASNNNTIKKMLKSDLSIITESVTYGGPVYGMQVDGEYLYIGGATTLKIWKINKLTMAKVSESLSYGGQIESIASDDTYLYVCGRTTQTVWKLLKTTLAKVAESTNFNSTIYDVVVDEDYVYYCGQSSNVRKLLKSNMSLVSNGSVGAGALTCSSIAVIGGFVYVGLMSAVDPIRQLSKTDMAVTKKLSSASVQTINVIYPYGEDIYIGGQTPSNIRQIENAYLVNGLRRVLA